MLTLDQKFSPILLATDLDGTLFEPDVFIFRSIFYNLKIKQIIEDEKMIFIAVTGRKHWSTKEELLIHILGLPLPDIVVAEAGNAIYVRDTNNHLIADHDWKEKIASFEIQYPEGKSIWNEQKNIKIVEENLKQFSIQTFGLIRMQQQLRILVKSVQFEILNKIKESITKAFQNTIDVIFTEKLLWQNTEKYFSGEIILIPSISGKQRAFQYILENLLQSKQIKKCLLAGDASIDIPFLETTYDTLIEIDRYGVNLIPHVYQILQQNKNVSLFEQNGSYHLYQWIMNQRPKTQDVSRNSSIRQVIKPFQSFIDSCFDQNLSADEISLQGLDLMKKSLEAFANGNKIGGLQLYIKSLLADVADGIRARKKGKSEQGQLIDVYCDRMKEFEQLIMRTKKRLTTNKDDALQTTYAALSCILPSIARAQSEIFNIVVPEYDAKGGSMLARTFNLALSLLYTLLGFESASYAMDVQIQNTNLATFANRLKYKSSFTIDELKTLKETSLNELQTKALERWLLLVDVLQRQVESIQQIPGLQFDKTKMHDLSIYLNIPITEIRNYFGFKKII